MARRRRSPLSSIGTHGKDSPHYGGPGTPSLPKNRYRTPAPRSPVFDGTRASQRREPLTALENREPPSQIVRRSETGGWTIFTWLANRSSR